MIRASRHIRKNRSKAATSARRRWWHTGVTRALALVATATAVPLVALACILAHDLITQGSFYRIHQTEISGTDRLSPQDILQQAAIAPALNLLGVNLGAVRQRLEAHPWIAEASVARHFPDRLIIRVREEQPTAQVAMEKQWYLVNAAGALFVVRDDPEPDLPVITGIYAADLNIDGRLPAATWQTVSALIGYFELAGKTPSTHITVDRDAGVSIENAPWFGTLRLGGTPAAQALPVVERIATHLSAQGHQAGVVAVDVSNPSRVVVAPSPPTERREETHEENKYAA